MPLAPAASALALFGPAAADVLRSHGLGPSFVDREAAEMATYRLTKTHNRSVLGIMNEFAYLADARRVAGDDLDLVQLSLRLAETPCSPLYGTHISPDRALAAIAGQGGCVTCLLESTTRWIRKFRSQSSFISPRTASSVAPGKTSATLATAISLTSGTSLLTLRSWVARARRTDSVSSGDGTCLPPSRRRFARP